MTREQIGSLRAAAATMGQSLRDFLLEAARLSCERRTPESVQAGVRIYVDGRRIDADPDCVEALYEAAEREAEYFHRLASDLTDPRLRRHYHQRAGRAHDARIWLGPILEAARRRRWIVESGQRQAVERNGRLRMQVSPAAAAAALPGLQSSQRRRQSSQTSAMGDRAMAEK